MSDQFAPCSDVDCNSGAMRCKSNGFLRKLNPRPIEFWPKKSLCQIFSCSGHDPR